MMSTPGLFAQAWYVAVPSLLLATLTYMLAARLVIDLAFNPEANFPFRLVVAVTNPVVRAVGAITPRIVPAALVTLAAIAWLLALRIVLVQVLAALAMSGRL